MGPLLELGPSTEPVGLSALALGLALLLLGLLRGAWFRRFLARGTSASSVGSCALFALLLSAGYIVYFLRGGPRIIDATSYWLEARALAEGKLAFDVPEPTAAFHGRFTLFGPHGLSVIFPPGYPLALALGFLVGAPLAVGPVLAALLVTATYLAAKELELGEATARLAALFSALCAALRYHTADTMSHGLSALLLTASFTAALRPTRGRAVLAGLLAGWLIATRPMTGVVATGLVFALISARTGLQARYRTLAGAACSLLPGLALLAAHQRAATGLFFHSTQLAYYAAADGPPGCFRWGFGSGIGCRFEHGDFVKKHLGGGFGLLAALYVTGERLLWHAFDIVNVAVLAPLAPWFVWRERRLTGVRWAGAAVALVILAYVPFYFPGSYPGGGARILADALPLEQVLVAGACLNLGLDVLAPGVVVLGFALSTIHSHLALRDREGGRPMFEPKLLETSRVEHGLVWVATDHGFALGHDPGARDPQTSVIVARRHGDAHDVALWYELGRPPSFEYRYSTETGAASLIAFDPSSHGWRWEAEAEWPPRFVRVGWAHPDFQPCLSGGSGLNIQPTPTASIELELGAPAAAVYAVNVGWLARVGATATLDIGEHTFRLAHRTGDCEETHLDPVPLQRFNRMSLRTDQPLVLDYVELGAPVSK
jgi:hypothetical protein